MVPAISYALRISTIVAGLALGISALLVGLVKAAESENRPASTMQSTYHGVH
jgi:hypothetical protein